MPMTVMVRGGGDLASGVALRLYRSGFRVVITELPRPLAVRRLVSFSEAVYERRVSVEGVPGVRVDDVPQALEAVARGEIPVVVDPGAESLSELQPAVLVDARMTKRSPELSMRAASLVIGLGPGFEAGQTCHAVIETHRGHTLGRVIWQGTAIPDTGLPGAVGGHQAQRVLRAPAEGRLQTSVDIGDLVSAGQILAEVDGRSLKAPFDGVVRGLLRNGTRVTTGLKTGDVDPRGDPESCRMVSDKSLAIAGGVLEAILARFEFRPQLRSENA